MVACYWVATLGSNSEFLTPFHVRQGESVTPAHHHQMLRGAIVNNFIVQWQRYPGLLGCHSENLTFSSTTHHLHFLLRLPFTVVATTIIMVITVVFVIVIIIISNF
jgi:hypothetical protein